MEQRNDGATHEPRVISEDERVLFDKLIKPNLEFIRSLVMYYTNNYQDVEDNMQYVLCELAKGVATYDENRSLKTWIHICVKNGCKRQKLRASKHNAMKTGLSLEAAGSLKSAPTVNIEDTMMFIDSVSDEMRDALLRIPPLKLSPFLLQAQGYSIRDITLIEVERGHLAEYSEYTVKSRIFWARNRLKEIMSRYGYR